MAVCGFGLEAVVARELWALGFEDAKPAETGAVRWTGRGMEDVARANLWLRSADRVLIVLSEFEARDFDALFDGTRLLPWAEWIPQDGAFPVRARSVRSQLSSVPAVTRAIKKAIVEGMLAGHGASELPESGPTFAVQARLLNDQLTLLLDTSGEALHKRGYRKEGGPAPLRETLAAAMISLSRWTPDRPLADPFCGSGTIPIEAALIATNIAPGLHRAFDAEYWGMSGGVASDGGVPQPRTDGWVGRWGGGFEQWEQVRADAYNAVRTDVQPVIAGYDLAPEALVASRRNAERAHVRDLIHFQQRAFKDFKAKGEYGCVVTNPPYGVRLEDRREAESLLRSMPSIFRHLPTWSFSILTDHEGFEGMIGQEASKRRKLYNGAVECTLYRFDGPQPVRRAYYAPVAVPPVGTPEEVPLNNAHDDFESGAHDSASAEAFVDEVIATDAQSAQSELEADEADRSVSSEAQEDPQPSVQHQQGAKGNKDRGHAAFGHLRDADENRIQEFEIILAKRLRHFRKWPERGIQAYRLYDRDVAALPLIVDRYGEALHVSVFETQDQRSLAQREALLDRLLESIARVAELPKSEVFVKSRRRQIGRRTPGSVGGGVGVNSYGQDDEGDEEQQTPAQVGQYGRVAHQGVWRTVEEHGMLLRVNLSDYLDTGLFLDHRLTRAWVRERVQGKSFLNLFCYTGSFTVAAAMGGAARTVSVDLSNTYLEWARENLAINSLPTGIHSPHEIVRADVKAYLDWAERQGQRGGERFDLIVADPPTFSNSKSAESDWDVQHDHGEMLRRLLQLLNPGGAVLFSTNHRRFELDGRLPRIAEIKETTARFCPEDFRKRPAHRSWLLRPLE